MNMFYISNITGGQTIYAPSIANVEGLNTENAAPFNLADQTITEDDVSVDISNEPQTILPQLFPSNGLATALASSGAVPTKAESAANNQTIVRRGKISAVSPIIPTYEVSDTILSRKNNKYEQQSTHNNPYAKLDRPMAKKEPAIVASQIMSSPVITLDINNVVEQAWNLIKEKRFRHLPITSQQGKLVGIISDRDFLSLNIAHIGEELSSKQQLKSPIKNIMTTNVLTARPNTAIRLIAQIMFVEKVSSMPIVDEDKKLVGILTTNDILRTLVHNAPLELWT